MRRWSVGVLIVAAGCTVISKDEHEARLALCFPVTEVPGDGKDGDCDTREACFVDEDDDERGGTVINFISADYGVRAGPFDCKSRPGLSSDSGDCDDKDPERYPGNTEQCDGIDQDCSPNPVSVCFSDTPEEVQVLLDRGDLITVGITGSDDSKIFGGYTDNDPLGDLLVLSSNAGEPNALFSLEIFQGSNDGVVVFTSGNTYEQTALGVSLATRTGVALIHPEKLCYRVPTGTDCTDLTTIARSVEDSVGTGGLIAVGSVAIVGDWASESSTPLLAFGIRYGGDTESESEQSKSAVILALPAVPFSQRHLIVPNTEDRKESRPQNFEWGTKLGVVRGSSKDFLLIVGKEPVELSTGGALSDTHFVDAVDLSGTIPPGPSEASSYLTALPYAVQQVFGCDTDGDGEEEAVVLGHGSTSSPAGSLQVYPAPGPALPVEALYQIKLDKLASSAMSAACLDYDGNGIGDLVVVATHEVSSTNHRTEIQVFLGRSKSEVVVHPEKPDLTWFGVDRGDDETGAVSSSVLGSSVTGVPDLNGDGRDEIAFGRSSSVMEYGALYPEYPTGFGLIWGRSSE